MQDHLGGYLGHRDFEECFESIQSMSLQGDDRDGSAEDDDARMDDTLGETIFEHSENVRAVLLGFQDSSTLSNHEYLL